MTRRREFIAQLAVLSGAAVAAAQDILYSLKEDSAERLRNDFNANREKVRLVFMLSPT